MPSFDVLSEVSWQEIDNAVQQAQKEVLSRFDFKNIKCELTVDSKAKTLTLWCSESEKLDALKDVLENKFVKRGVSLLCLDYQTAEHAHGSSIRQLAVIRDGIASEHAKKITAALRDQKFKAQSQIQGEQLRVTAKSRDELQTVMAFLRSQQDTFKIPLQFKNFRD